MTILPKGMASLAAWGDNLQVALNLDESPFKDDEATILPQPLFRVLASLKELSSRLSVILGFSRGPGGAPGGVRSVH